MHLDSLCVCVGVRVWSSRGIAQAREKEGDSCFSVIAFKLEYEGVFGC